MKKIVGVVVALAVGVLTLAPLTFAGDVEGKVQSSSTGSASGCAWPMAPSWSCRPGSASSERTSSHR